MTERAQVFKFGGTSVGSATALRAAASITGAAMPGVVAVVSAMSGVTDLLLEAARAARDGDLTASLAAAARFRGRHSELITQLFLSQQQTQTLLALNEQQSDELDAICRSVALLRELTTRTQDLIVARGERLLAQIFCVLFQERYGPAVYLDATALIMTERRLGSLWPNLERCTQAAHELILPCVARGELVVLPGFIGHGPDGEVITLGRGGSDFSAAVIAHSLNAERVTLYKEVDGLMTADPKSVPEARVLPELHYREAAELAYYGAKVLHPRTMIPLLERQIPLHIKNTFNPALAGTTISADATPGSYPVRALTAISGQALISVEGNGMMGVPGVAQKTFGALSAAGHSVSMISQASSEASICLVVPESEADSAQTALHEAFQQEIAARLIDAIRVEKQIALVAVVGLGMRGTPGIAARTFTALARQSINIIAMAQGSSELNITVALKQSDVPRALRSLHQEYQLDRLRPLPDTSGKDTALTIMGFGQIGRALSRQLLSQAPYFHDDLGITLRQVGLVDKSGLVLDEAGFSAEALAGFAAQKVAGLSLLEPASQTPLLEALRLRLFSLPAYRSVLVDLTAEETVPILREALSRGSHVVLANKKPLAAPQEQFDSLFEAARASGVSLRYEATVGAGLPVLDTLQKLREAGDPVHRVVGCLSGTLGYLMSALEDGTPFSVAVQKAYELGYTEPDPRDDLCGMDVARKALIIARSLGRRIELSDIAVTSLFPKEVSDPNPKLFLQKLTQLDEAFTAQIAEARREQKVLRYVARIEPDSVAVGLEAVPESSPLGRLRGTDNSIVFYTKRYAQNPLVVTGPGAGAEVTAAGVLNDILAISNLGRFGGPIR